MAAPSFFVMGNHDGGVWSAGVGGLTSSEPMRAFVSDCGLTLLHNRGIDFEARGQSLRLVGVGDLWSRECDPLSAFGRVRGSDDRPTLLLAHNPDSKTYAEAFDWDLMLSGHTHGGQLSLPFVGEPFAPVGDKRYVDGLRDWQGRWIQVTRGVGAGLRARFNCRPEVSLLELGPDPA